MRQTTSAEDPSTVSNLVGEIVDNVQTLMRQEFVLAKTEVKREVSHAKTMAILGGAGLVLFAFAAMLVTLALVRLLEQAGVALWLAYGFVALVYAVGGLGLVRATRNRMRSIDPVPRETVKTMQENIQWLKKRT